MLKTMSDKEFLNWLTNLRFDANERRQERLSRLKDARIRLMYKGLWLKCKDWRNEEAIENGVSLNEYRIMALKGLI